ncbi:hypothetical protein E4U42_001133 [Claviceps africana]|uniref:Uncharacterized protein n=1 Tax=Claviceps africana TaxID=83212 RepID=A0A8K0JCC5_9HYPO|nr:hypothetical protein E4U42_001133 [Claviceps africana]
MNNFAWMRKIGATNEAVAVLNDQPNLFVNFLLVLAGLGGQCLLIWYIHFATLKPEQARRKNDGKKSAVNTAKAGPRRK